MHLIHSPPPYLYRGFIAMTVVKSIKSAIKRIAYSGGNRECTVCGRRVKKFLPFAVAPRSGTEPRDGARCPICNSLERHRFAIWFLHEKTDLFDGRPKAFLHIAPEPFFVDRFAEAAGEGYLTADLMDPTVMEKMDVTDIHHPDQAFNAIYCSHVLEHVPDDRKAMREFYRTLKVGGWAILNVPVTIDRTVEDPTATDPQERLRLYGQSDHVRRYGRDYADRLAEAGFTVERITPDQVLDPQHVRRFGLENESTDAIYYCTRPAHDEQAAATAAGDPTP